MGEPTGGLPAKNMVPPAPSYAAVVAAKTPAAAVSTPKVIPDLGTLSTCRGEPAFFISRADLLILSRPFENALVARFPDYRPRLDDLRGFFTRLELKLPCKLGLLDNRHVLVQPGCQDDYNRLFTRGLWKVGKARMIFTKWTIDFRLNEDSPLVPVWFVLPDLPLPLLNEFYVEKLANLIGRPLKVDASTRSMTRPSVARVLVEVDVAKPVCTRFWVGEGVNDGFWQEVHAESWPSFCTYCKRLGHLEEGCKRKYPSFEPTPPLNPSKQPVGGSKIKKVYVPIVPTTDRNPDNAEQHHPPAPNEHVVETVQPNVAEEPSTVIDGTGGLDGIREPMIVKGTVALDPSAKSFEYPKNKIQNQIEKGQHSAPVSKNTGTGNQISHDSLRAFHSTLQARFDVSGVIPDSINSDITEKDPRTPLINSGDTPKAPTPTYLESALKGGESEPDAVTKKKGRARKKDKTPPKKRSYQHDKFACSSDIDKIKDQLDASDKESKQYLNSKSYDNYEEWTEASENEDYLAEAPYQEVTTRARNKSYHKYDDDYEYY